MAPRQPSKSAPRQRAAQATPRNKDSKESHKVVKARSSKVHKRSRDGCFTCRLRRKKCSETHPKCDACTSLDIPCEYDQPDWWTNEAKMEAHHRVISERIKMTRVTNKMSSISFKPSKAQDAAQRQLDSRQAQELQGAAPESFQHSSDRHKAMPWNDHAAMSTLSSYPFEDSVVDNTFDVANEFAYDNNTRLDVSGSYATLRSTEAINGPDYIHNIDNITARIHETVLDQNNIHITSSIPPIEEDYAGILNSDEPSQFYAGDGEELQGDLMWQEAYDFGQPRALLYRDVHD